MKLELGLQDDAILQRTPRQVSDARFSGTCSASGAVIATVYQRRRPLRRFNAIRIGRAAQGRFQGVLKGLPVGGPYEIALHIGHRDKVLETCTVRRVLVGDIWLAAGQSNMQGGHVLPKPFRAATNARAFFMDDRWGPAREPLHNMWAVVDEIHNELNGGRPPAPQPGIPWRGVSPAIGFVDTMARRTGIPQGIIASAHGGTCMRQWDPALKDLGGRSLYGAAARRIAKVGGRIAGVIWYQGEGDAGPDDTAVYVDRMKALIAAFRRDSHNARLPFVLVQLSRVVGIVGDPTWWNRTQELQRCLPDMVPHCATVPAIDSRLGDLIHIDGPSLIRTGRRLAEAMLSLTRHPKAGPPPIRFKQFTIEPDYMTANVIVEFEHVVGALQSVGRPAGFAVVDRSSGQVMQYVFDIRLEGPKAILRTTLPPSDLQERDLHYGYGTDPLCNITDQADRSLPVMGPIRLGRPRAFTEFLRELRVSDLYPATGPIRELAFPETLDLRNLHCRTFPATFCFIVVAEMSAPPPSHQLVYAGFRLTCDTPMELALDLGYDGPIKIWVDGREIYCDPDGRKPSMPGHKQAPFTVAAGDHTVLIALDSNEGETWGVFVRVERLDVPEAVIAKGPAYYSMPRISV